MTTRANSATGQRACYTRRIATDAPPTQSERSDAIPTPSDSLSPTPPTSPSSSSPTSSPSSSASALKAALYLSSTGVVAAWSHLSDGELYRKGTVGTWSFRDVDGHLAAWDLWLVETLPRRLSGTPLAPEQQRALDDQDAWNAEQVAERDSLTRREQLEESARARGALVELVTRLGDSVLSQPVRWPEWEGTLAEYLQARVIAHDTQHCEALWAAREALAGWEWCEIVAVPGPTTRAWWAAPAVFSAVGVDASGLYIAGQSLDAHAFEVWPDNSRHLFEDKRSFRALHELVKDLEEEGWQPYGKGREWFSHRFRRRTGP